MVDIEAAARGDSPLVHEDLGTNLSVETSGTAGDPDGAFRVAIRDIPSGHAPDTGESVAGHSGLWITTANLRAHDSIPTMRIPEGKKSRVSGDGLELNCTENAG